MQVRRLLELGADIGELLVALLQLGGPGLDARPLTRSSSAMVCGARRASSSRRPRNPPRPRRIAEASSLASWSVRLAAESSRWVSARLLGAGLDAHGVRGGDGLRWGIRRRTRAPSRRSGQESDHGVPPDARPRRGPQDGYACSGEARPGHVRCREALGASVATRPIRALAVRAPSSVGSRTRSGLAHRFDRR